MHDIAVVIPVKNEGKTIQPLLKSLEALQEKPKEVVVVDGGSSDQTVGLIRDYIRSASLPYSLKVIGTDGALPGKGRNLGVQNSTAPLIACTDAGGVVDRNWLGELIAPFQDPEVDLVVGCCRSNASTFFERLSFFLFLKNIRRKSLIYSGGASIAFRRTLWEEIGGFPEALYPCEDKYFLIKARQRARRVREAPAACVYWSPRSNLIGFANQYFLYGRGDGRIRFAPLYHGLRLLAYGAGVLLVFLGGPVGRGVTATAFFAYLGEVSLRAFREIRSGRVFLCVPLLLVVKDLSQIVGFPLGWLEGSFDATFRQLRKALGPRPPDATH